MGLALVVVVLSILSAVLCFPICRVQCIGIHFTRGGGLTIARGGGLAITRGRVTNGVPRHFPGSIFISISCRVSKPSTSGEPRCIKQPRSAAVPLPPPTLCHAWGHDVFLCWPFLLP